MTKLRFLMFSMALLSVAVCGKAQAAIEAYANLNITGFELINASTGARITNGVELTVSSVLFTSGAIVDVASIGGGPIATNAVGATSTVGHNTLQAFEGAGAAPAQNTFTNFSGTNPFARGDSTGTGAIINGLAESAPASASSVSEVDLANLNILDVGSADSSVTSLGAFTVRANEDVIVEGRFSASRSMFAELIPSPPGSTAAADTSFSISITDQNGVVVFRWDPNGQAGGITGGTEIADPFDLNGGISAAPGGSSTLNNATASFAARFVLLENMTYSFNIEHSTAADASTVPGTPPPGVPEMPAVLVWSVLALVGGGAARFRSGKKA